MNIYNIYIYMLNLNYRLCNNKFYLNLLLKNKDIGHSSLTVCNNVLFLNDIYIKENYRLNKYGTYLMNSSEIIGKNYYNINQIKLKIYDENLLYFFFNLGFDLYDISYTNYKLSKSYKIYPLFKNID